MPSPPTLRRPLACFLAVLACLAVNTVVDADYPRPPRDNLPAGVAFLVLACGFASAAALIEMGKALARYEAARPRPCGCCPCCDLCDECKACDCGMKPACYVCRESGGCVCPAADPARDQPATEEHPCLPSPPP